MEALSALVNQRGLIRIEHGKHGSRAMLWLEPEIEKVLGFRGAKNKATPGTVRPYCCLICNQLCAMPCILLCEKRDMGSEWTTYKQTTIELSGALICSHCRSGNSKIRIDSFRTTVDYGEACGCTWNGVTLFDCVACKARNRIPMSSRALWESLRVLKPLGYFKDMILTRFSRHPYLGMREHERNALMEARFPIWPRDRPEVQDRVLREREEYVKELKKKDRERDLTLTDIESAKWSFTLWREPLLRCFPEVDIKQGSRGKIAWIYVKIDNCWQVRSWSNLAIELAQGGEWVETPNYDKDYRGTQPRSNVTKERRASTRKMKTVQLTVAPPNDLNKHKVWCSATNAFVNGAYYDNEQITEEPTEVFSVIMHYKINILACAHPDFDWIGGIEAELHEKQPDVRVVRRGFMRKTCRLQCEPQK